MLVFFMPLLADEEQDGCQKEIEKIDTQIEKLNAQKQQHLELAAKYQKLGDQWQYSSGRIEEAHQNWNKANVERQKAIDIQLQIDELLERKQRIYQFYPQLWKPS